MPHLHVFRSADYCQNVETRLLCDSVAPDKMVGGCEHVFLLVPVHKCFRFSVTVVLPCLDLTEYDELVIFGNDVHLKMVELPVTCKNAVIVFDEVVYGRIFPLKSDRTV